MHFPSWVGTMVRLSGHVSLASIALQVILASPCPPCLPSRMRQLEEELRTMDQALKSLMAAEEEVPSWGSCLHLLVCSQSSSSSLSFSRCLSASLCLP